MQKPTGKSQAPGQIRIIGGRWRGRKIVVADQPDLRPTPDRVRETLFNWLQHDIVDSHCIDMFAGSGALGIEALSRGAAFVDFIEHSSLAIKQLRQTLLQFAITNAAVHHGDALMIMPRFTKPIDIVFLDPPFQQNLLIPCCAFLELSPLINTDNRVYIETDKPLAQLGLSEKWQCLREKKAGHVFYYLFHCKSG